MKNGPEVEENQFPACTEKGTQTEVITSVDVSVGDSFVGHADVGVQTSCGPRGGPDSEETKAEEKEKEWRADKCACVPLSHS